MKGRRLGLKWIMPKKHSKEKNLAQLFEYLSMFV